MIIEEKKRILDVVGLIFFIRFLKLGIYSGSYKFLIMFIYVFILLLNLYV